jgi:hypothetical protein
MSALFEQDEALSNTLAVALLIHTLESRQVYPLLGLEPPVIAGSPPLVRLPGMVWPRLWFVIGSPSKNSMNKTTSHVLLKIRCVLPMIHTSVFSKQHNQGKEVKPPRKRLRQLRSEETREETTSKKSPGLSFTCRSKKPGGSQLTGGCSDDLPHRS